MRIIEDSNEGFNWRSGYDITSQHIIVDYSYITKIDPREAAYVLCREQSTSTWNHLHSENKSIRYRRGAKLIRISNNSFRIGYPLINIEPQMSQVLVTIIGNGSFLNNQIFSSLRVTDIKIPYDITKKFPGPRYGIQMLSWFKSNSRPIIIAVQKPSIGLSAEEHVARSIQALESGIEIVKEDEQLRPTDPDCNFDTRLRLVSSEIKKLISLTKKHHLYIFNLCSDTNLIEQIKSIEAHLPKTPIPAFGIMVSQLQGLSTIRQLRESTKLPILTHPSGMGILTRGPFGFSIKPLTLLMRLSGADIIIHPAPFSKLSNCSVQEASDALQMASQKIKDSLCSIVAFGCGISINVVRKLAKEFSKHKFALLVGGAIFGHPLGPKEGAFHFCSDILRYF